MKRNTRYRLGAFVIRTISTLFKLVMAVFFLFPFYWMITTAFKTYGESILFPPTLLPEHPSWDSFLDVGERIEIGHYLKNSCWYPAELCCSRRLLIFRQPMGLHAMSLRGKN